MLAPRERLSPLMALRLFAAIRIMLFHIVDWNEQPVWLRSIMTTPVGVTFFFVMSGFALTYVYDQQHELGRFSARRFYLGRVGRILPVYVFGLLVAIPLLAHSHAFRWGYAVATATLTQAWLPTGSQFWNYPLWALSAEAFFYLLFPFFLDGFRNTSARRLLMIAAAVWFLSLFPGLLYHWLHPDGLYYTSYLSSGFWLRVLKYNPLARLPEFVLGVIAGKLYLRRGGLNKWAAPAFTLAAVVIFGTLAYGRLFPYEVVNNGLLAPAIAVAVMSLASGGYWARLFSNKALVLLGSSSYCIYVLHVPLWEYAHWLWPKALNQSHPLSLLVAFGIVVISVVGYVIFEKPASAWARAKLHAPSGAPHALHAAAGK